MSEIVIDQLKPDRILQVIGNYPMAFAESYKGEGGPSDANFQPLATNWYQQPVPNVIEIWFTLFRRNVARACASGFGMCEFWGWPEVRCRDDGTCQVMSRVRFLKIVIKAAPRVIS